MTYCCLINSLDLIRWLPLPSPLNLDITNYFLPKFKLDSQVFGLSTLPKNWSLRVWPVFQVKQPSHGLSSTGKTPSTKMTCVEGRIIGINKHTLKFEYELWTLYSWKLYPLMLCRWASFPQELELVGCEPVGMSQQCVYIITRFAFHRK